MLQAVQVQYCHATSIKERFIEQYGLPKFTIATGSSGGSIQQHYIAQNYPGLLDAISPNASFSDLASMAADVLDCQVLINYFNQNTNPADWPGNWLERILADHSNLPYATKVVLNKPDYLKDACWYNGVKHEEPLTLDPSATCNQLMPVYGTVRLAAGGSLGGTALKCQLKPVTVTDYAVSFTPAELARLNTIFPQGVCDWSKPGVVEQFPADTWLRFLPEAGTWARMGIQASATTDPGSGLIARRYSPRDPVLALAQVT